jgi:hypothetical protein
MLQNLPPLRRPVLAGMVSLCAALGGLALSTTALAASTPVVESESFEDVGSSSATLRGQIDPEGTPTSYFFEYGPSAAYGSVTPLVALGAAESGVGAPAVLSGLQPAETYHFRVVATNQLGTVRGADETFASLALGIIGLPDSRAYELVTPVSNHDADAYAPDSGSASGNDENGLPTQLPYEAAADGHAVAYIADPTTGGDGTAGQGGGNQYLATRAAGGSWTQSNILPPDPPLAAFYEAFSSDLSIGIMESGPVGGSLGESDLLLAAGGTPHYNDLFAHDNSDGSYHALSSVVPPNRGLFEEFYSANVPGSALVPVALDFAGESTDHSHMLFEANDALTANAVDGGQQTNNLYDSVGGRLHLVNVLPDGSPAANASFGAPRVPGSSPHDQPDFSRVLSGDGSRVFWTDLSTNDLYVRSDDTSADATTVQVDASQGPGGGGGGRFWTASSDGSKVFFTDCSRLTPDSTAVFSATCGEYAGEPAAFSGNDLYEYDVASKHLTDLTVDGRTGDALGADVQGVMGASEDGEYVYFVADGVLDPGAAAAKPNLYLRHDGATRFIATLSLSDGQQAGTYESGDNSGEAGDWQPGMGHRTADASSDGEAAVFMSNESLTGYPNRGLDEVYVYEAQTGQLICASCSSSGEVPQQTAEVGRGASAAFLPISYQMTYQPRVISDGGGRVFFDSAEPLVPQDTNGQRDVYEWERDGVGSCQQTPGEAPSEAIGKRQNGCVYLLSGGSSPAASTLIDASADGSDVFVVSRAPLTPEAVGDDADHVYDISVGGQMLTAPACSGTGCQGVPAAPPVFATPASATFSGVGNFPPPAKSTVKPKVKRLTVAQKRAKAVRSCRAKRDRRRRVACEAQARRRYGAKPKPKTSNGRNK